MADTQSQDNGSDSSAASEGSTKWDRNRVADSIVYRHAALASGAALVPSPLVDIAAVTAVQLNMIQRLSDLYDVSFSKEAGKNVLLALIGSVLPMTLRATGVSLLKAIPGLGTVAGTLALPALSAASTYATGAVMIRHYESGGTLLNFDAKKAREYFQEKLEEGAQATS